MKPTYKFETFSRKPLLGRRHYYWRIRHQNGRIICHSSEGYYNYQDMMEAYYRMRYAINDGRVMMPEGV